MNTPIRLFIVDDQVLIRDGLRSLLSRQPDMDVMGDAANGAEFLTQLEALSPEEQPHVVLLDIRMPVMDGIVTTQQLRSCFPVIRILILTTFDDDVDVAQAMRAGAHGYLLKSTPSQDLAIAIRSIYQGYSYLSPGLMEKIFTPVAPNLSTLDLTPREQEILQLIATGANNREIAATLFIAERTVKNHVTNILQQLGLRNRTQAALYIQKHQF